MRRTITTTSPEETRLLAAGLARKLRGGELIALRGELGSGKTCFTQGLAKGLGVKGRVRSPSFIIMAGYQGRLKLHHFDFYRLDSEKELEELGLEECCRLDSVVVIEWAEKFTARLPQGAMWLEMEWRSEEERKLRFGRGFPADYLAGVLDAKA